MAFSLVGSTIQLPAVGGGSQAATFLVFTLVFGVEKEPAMVASIVIWLIGSASCALVGLPLLFREGWSMGELGRMARAEEQASLPKRICGKRKMPRHRARDRVEVPLLRPLG